MTEKQIEMLACELMRKHGLLDKGWDFKWDNAKQRYGACFHKQRWISLSKPLSLLDNLDHLTDTILHEIAHALVGTQNGHNKVWKRKAIEIGCTAQRCGGDHIRIKPKYVATCSLCDFRVERHKRRIGSACPECCDAMNDGKFSKEFELNWSLNK